MTTLTHQDAGRTTGGDNGVVLAVLQLEDPDVHVLRYASLVATVDARQLRVLVVRHRLGFSTDAALVAARRRVRNQVLREVGDLGGVLVDELVVGRRTRRDPQALWTELVGAARARRAAALVVPAGLGATAPHEVPGITVVTVLGRPGRPADPDPQGRGGERRGLRGRT